MSYVMLDTPNPYTAQGTFPRRGGAKLSGTVILHTTEGNWQSGVASLTGLVKTRSDYGCYHQACDWADIVMYYPWEWECWQDSETNNWAVGISAACKTSDWAIMPANIREGYYRNMATMAADFVRYMAGKGITVPLKRITGAQARARVPGFCAHGDSGIARSDPGAAFDWALFFRYTQEALNNGGSLANSGTTITPISTDPMEEIMGYYRDRADFEGHMRRLAKEGAAEALASAAPAIAKAVWDYATLAADGKTKTPMHRALRDPLNGLSAAVAADRGLSAEQLQKVIEDAMAKSSVVDAQAVADRLTVTVKEG